MVTLVLVLFVAALVLFATEWWPVEVTALLLLCALLISGLLTPKEALAPFGSDTVLTLASLFMLTRSLLKTGVIEGIGQALSKRSSSAPTLLRGILGVVAGVSAFTSNTATTAVFLPVVAGLCRRSGISASRALMPLAFASILGGTVTVIGTSTNLVVSGALGTYKLAPLGFFELAWVGLPVALVGLLYLFFVAPRWLPQRETPLEDAYNLRAYLADLNILPTSVLAGQTLRDSGLGRDYELSVLQVRRGEQIFSAPSADFRLEAGDTLAVEGHSEKLLSGKSALGIISKPEQQLLSDPNTASAGELRLVEAVVMPRSALLGRTLKEVRFRERYGLSVIALHRRARHEVSLSRTRIQVGDVLLIQGPAERLNGVSDQLTVLGDLTGQQREPRRAALSLGIFALAIALGAFNVVPLVVALLCAVTLTLALKILSPEEGYGAVEWGVLVLVACMLAFGNAFEHSGAAQLITSWLSHLLAPLGPYGVLAALFVVTVLLTQPMSNQAAALVMLPLAIGLAHKLGYDPRPFVIGITVAASNSFITPLEPSCMLVFGPGHYRFSDFVKVGSGLTLVTLMASLLIIPLVWPFTS